MPELELKVETVERNGRTVREALGTLSSGLRVRFLVPSNYGLAALWGGMPGLKKLTSADPKAVGETTSEMWKRITAMLEAYTLVPKMARSRRVRRTCPTRRGSGSSSLRFCSRTRRTSARRRRR